MADIFDYLYWRGDLTFSKAPFCEVDGVILARLSYQLFEKILGKGEKITVKAAAKRILSLPDLENIIRVKNDVRFLGELAKSKRFSGLKLSDFVSRTDKETQTQFSAITAEITKDLRFVAFRGTDNTIIGWKEDFNMGFVCPVPAQQLAVGYLEEAAKGYDGEFLIGGHSKGGNLAVYSAAFCKKEIQPRIKTVWNYDGPGFDEKVLSKQGYKNICDRVRTFVPQSSVVGMLLSHEEEYTIVHSRNTGIMQHDIYSWDVERDGFSYLETVDNSSKFVDYTLKAWIADMDYEQREKFTDAIFEVISETNVSTLHELGENWFENTKTVLKSVKNLDEPTRKAVTQAIKLLAKSAGTGLTRIIQPDTV